MKRILAIVCICVMLFSFTGCKQTKQRFQYTYLNAFDTVTILQLYAESQSQADEWAAQLHAEMLRLHDLFTIYDTVEGTVNLKAVNQSGGDKLTVGDELFSLLEFGKQAYTLTEGRVNMAMGSVLSIWHTARTVALDDPEKAAVPTKKVLTAAAQHMDIEKVVLDPSDQTITLTDADLSLDVGAFAKGYAVQRLADYARKLGITSALISVGGNIVAVGDKMGEPFKLGIEDPRDPQSYLHIVKAKDCAVVTSGNYQRYFTVDGEQYHHLIDPDTLYPAKYWTSVSVIGPDSGMADMLSTALFLLPQAEGEQLLETAGDYEAVWVNDDGNSFFSDGFSAYLE